MANPFDVWDEEDDLEDDTMGEISKEEILKEIDILLKKWDAILALPFWKRIWLKNEKISIMAQIDFLLSLYGESTVHNSDF